MKAKTIEKAVKGKKSYTMAEIREAIAYWKGRLASLNESDGGEGDAENDVDDVDDDVVSDKGGGIGLPDEDKVEDKAKASPVGAFNFTKRFYRMHLHAEKVVKEKLGKLLNKSKLGDGNSVVIENSAVDESSGLFDMDVENILITIKVQIDKAKVKGFRKFLAVIKEDDVHNPDMVDEGLLSALFKGLGDTAKGVKKAGQEKIAAANEDLKNRVGVAAMQEYFNAFFGKLLAKKITTKNVFAGADEEGSNGAYFVYCSSVTIKS